MSLSPKHERDGAPIPRHPYRDSALMYGILAVIIMVVGGLTGGHILKAVLVSLGFFLVATGWTWFRFHGRIKAHAAAAAAADTAAAAERDA